MSEMPYQKGDVIVCSAMCSIAKHDPRENSAGGWTYGYNPDVRKATEADIQLQIDREKRNVDRHSRWLCQARQMMETLKERAR